MRRGVAGGPRLQRGPGAPEPVPDRSLGGATSFRPAGVPSTSACSSWPSSRPPPAGSPRSRPIPPGSRVTRARSPTWCARRRGRCPSVVMGDFNAGRHVAGHPGPDGEAGWVDTFRPREPHGARASRTARTWRRARPTAAQRIDYVLLAPGARVPGRVVASRVVLREPRGRAPCDGRRTTTAC